jgi:hypothetical protein
VINYFVAGSASAAIGGRENDGGSMLMALPFNAVEGIVDHYLKSFHHVNETVPPGQWIYWMPVGLGGRRCCWWAGNCSSQETRSRWDALRQRARL